MKSSFGLRSDHVLRHISICSHCHLVGVCGVFMSIPIIMSHYHTIMILLGFIIYSYLSSTICQSAKIYFWILCVSYRALGELCFCFYSFILGACVLVGWGVGGRGNEWSKRSLWQHLTYSTLFWTSISVNFAFSFKCLKSWWFIKGFANVEEKTLCWIE